MLKSISLENYKCFKDKTEIEIAPLTVLCGVNSSGKSSILKSLLMLKQSYESNLSKGELLFSGKDVDNGIFKDIVFNGNENNFTINTSFIIDDSYQAEFDKYNYRVDVSDFRDLNRIFDKVVLEKNIYYRISISITTTGNIEPTTPFQALRNKIEKFNISIEIFSKNKKDKEALYRSCINITITPTEENPKEYEIEFISFPLISKENNRDNISDTVKKCTCYFDGIKIIKVYSKNPSQNYNMNNFLPNLYTLFDIIASQFYNIKHMSPLRLYPSRRYVITHSIKESDPTGEDFAQIIAQYGTETKEHIFMSDNVINGLPYKKEKYTLSNAVQLWASYLSMGKVNLEPKDEILKVNVDGHNILDVGFGVSQSLPILVSGLHAPRQSTIIFEQPEIHLHPNAQMGMSDFLISLALNNKNVIVETHSDHIINRIIRRVVENQDKTLYNMVKIYFVKQEYDEKFGYISKINPIKIDMIKGFIDADDDFFSQFGSESMKIFEAGLRNC